MKTYQAVIALTVSLAATAVLATGCNSAPRTAPTTVFVTNTVQAPPPAPGSGTVAPAPAPPSAPPPAPVPAPDAGCGPDQATALQNALARMAPEPVTAREWGPNAQGGNYNPCAALSTILVMVDGGTASSPMQALMFHRGTWLGTGTLRAYSFTSVDMAASTDDTVVLAYRSGQSCSACGDGILTRVRYHWDGNKVQMLDPPPPG